MRMPRSFDELDDHLIDLDLDGGDHNAAAQQCEQWAETIAAVPENERPGDLSEADFLVAAAEQCRILRDFDRSVALCERAIATGDPMRYDARAHMAAALFDAGEPERAREVLAALRAERSKDPTLHLFVGEILEADGDLDSAVAWFTRGLLIARRLENVTSTALLLLARHRVREVIGFPPDDFDEWAIMLSDAFADGRDREKVADELPGPTGRNAPCACGSGRKAKRCCGAVGDQVISLTSVEGDTAVIDLINA